jgi:hypothetical protein
MTEHVSMALILRPFAGTSESGRRVLFKPSSRHKPVWAAHHATGTAFKSMLILYGLSWTGHHRHHSQQAYVKITQEDWLLRNEDPIWAGRKRDPHVYEPIEGVTEEHVGWAKCPFDCVMTEYYMQFRDFNRWMRGCRRPPAMVG